MKIRLINWQEITAHSKFMDYVEYVTTWAVYDTPCHYNGTAEEAVTETTEKCLLHG
jgi:hypothetical protein